MNVSIVNDSVASWLRVCASKTLLAFHGVLVVAIIVVTVVVLALGVDDGTPSLF